MKNLFFLTLLLLNYCDCFGNVGITSPNLNINTCSFPSTYSALGNIVIDEGANTDFGFPAASTNYTIILTAPTNFEFQAATGTITNTALGDITALSMVVSTTTITITYQSSDANRTNEDDIITISGLQIRAITAASSASVTRTGGTGTVAGLVNTTPVANLVSAVSCGCSHIIRLTDTYGDGWNGGTIKVQVNGVDVLTGLTLGSGFGPADFTLTAATGDVINVVETAAGSWPTEMRVTVLDGGGTTILGPLDPGAGNSANGNCPPPMVISSSLVSQSSSASISNCSINEQIVRLEITTTGGSSPKTITQIQTNFTGTAAAGNMSSTKIYYTGTSTVFSTGTLFGSGVPSGSTYNINGSQVLVTGTNYFWLTYDMNNTGTIGNTVDAIISQFTATAVNYNSGTSPSISTTNPAGARAIAVCSAPGGITGSTLWLRSDASTNTTTNGALVSSWASQAATPVTVTQGTAAFQPTYKDGSGTGSNNRFNYNPFIYTDGSSNRLIQTGDINLGNTTTGFSVYQVIGEDNGIVAMDWYHTANGNIKIKGDGLMYINKADGSVQQNVYGDGVCTVQAFLQDLRGLPGSISGNGRFNGRAGTSYGNGWRVAAQNGICIGSNLDNGEYMQGGMGEFIVFPTILNATDNLKVESYLAIKHGITLGNPANLSNYLSSTGTTIWTGTAAYQNNIIGIGRDDNSVLLQKQSHYYDDTVRVYKGTLAATNVANTSTFAVDRSFVIVGANTGKLCTTLASLAEMPAPCLLYSRLEREWKVTKTNITENFNMDIKLAACGAPGSVVVADLRFLVDDDGDFGNGGTTCYYNGDGTGIVISYSNPTITISNISTTHIPNNSTKFVTIGSINEPTPLPTELLSFDAVLNEERNVDLIWTTASEINSDYFTVEKSLDVSSWEEIATVDAAGNSNEILNYATIDNDPMYGNNYYRLKQTDFDGSSNYSDIRMVSLKDNGSLSIYPNPTSSKFTITGFELESKEIKLFNAMGQEIQLSTIASGKDIIEYSVEGLSEGVYTVQIKTGTEFVNKKLIIIGS